LDSKEKENYIKINAVEAYRDLFITTAKAAPQSLPGTRVNLHKVEAVVEGLLLGESVEYTASQAHRPTPISMTHPSIPPRATREQS
jgi:hypothetical protein